MTVKEDVMLILILEDIVNSMVIDGITQVFYEPGRSIQILDNLNEKDNSISYKGLKYPLCAVILPVKEKRGNGYYANVRIPRIVFMTPCSTWDGSDKVLSKYRANGTFKKILYPIYYEFLNRCALHPQIVGMDPDAFVHEKMDNPANQPVGEGSNDYVDVLEILGLELTINQIINCI